MLNVPFGMQNTNYTVFGTEFERIAAPLFYK